MFRVPPRKFGLLDLARVFWPQAGLDAKEFWHPLPVWQWAAVN